jgi:hypothetical protein
MHPMRFGNLALVGDGHRSQGPPTHPGMGVATKAVATRFDSGRMYWF